MPDSAVDVQRIHLREVHFVLRGRGVPSYYIRLVESDTTEDASIRLNKPSRWFSFAFNLSMWSCQVSYAQVATIMNSIQFGVEWNLP